MRALYRGRKAIKDVSQSEDDGVESHTGRRGVPHRHIGWFVRYGLSRVDRLHLGAAFSSRDKEEENKREYRHNGATPNNRKHSG